MTSLKLRYTPRRLLLGTLLPLALLAAPAIDGSTTPTAAAFGADMGAFSNQLPVLVIDTRNSGPLVKDGVDHASTLRIYSSAASGAPSFVNAAQFTTATTISVRGSSSAEFPKKSFTVALRDAKGKKQAQPLLDLPAAETWVLVAPWQFDPSYINNALVYAMSNRLGRWAPRTRFVEVFLNHDGGDVDRADYAGIYVLTERIDVGENRVVLPKPAKGTPARDSGYIFKIDSADPDEFSWNTARGIDAGNSSLVLVSPKADDATAAQHDYIRESVQQMENALHADRATGWAQRTHLDLIDRAAWIDHHILNTLAANPDALVRSAYFTKAADGKVAAGPVWDFDRALGSHADLRSYRWDVWSGLGATDVWHTGWWGILAQDPEFRQAWIDRWQSLRRGELSNDSLSRLVTELGRSVTADAAARDAVRWPDNQSALGSHSAQLAHLRGWIVQHAQWIDEQFITAPSSGADGTDVIFTAPPGAVLVYTLDGSDPRSLGGAIAPNAEITATPLRVPATANAHLRSYRSDYQHKFPGSPWSSAVGTASASPLLPRARFVNLSSRAIAGAGDEMLIVGLEVSDTSSKRYLARAIGPGLTKFGVAGSVSDPQLSIFSGGTELARNRGWETGGNVAELIRGANAVGAFSLSAGSSDSALSYELAGGACTLQVTARDSGVGLAEVYELDDRGRITNLSTRAMIHGEDGALVAGFVIRGPACQRVLVRAVGPTLRRLGIANALAAPILTLYSGANKIGSNEHGAAAVNATVIAKATEAVGAFKLDPNAADAALFLTLPPGAYTVEIKASSAAGGIAVLEIYDVP